MRKNELIRQLKELNEKHQKELLMLGVGLSAKNYTLPYYKGKVFRKDGGLTKKFEAVLKEYQDRVGKWGLRVLISNYGDGSGAIWLKCGDTERMIYRIQNNQLYYDLAPDVRAEIRKASGVMDRKIQEAVEAAEAYKKALESLPYHLKSKLKDEFDYLSVE